MSHPLPIAGAILVAVVMAFLTAMTLRAWRRSRNRFLPFVGGAFLAFTVKNLVVAYGLWQGTPGHEDLEMIGAAFDALVAGLLVAPFLVRRA